MKGHRKERDSLGDVWVPNEKYWGAQTQRAVEHFNIGSEKMPIELIAAIALIKKAAARTNTELGLLPKSKMLKIVKAADEVMHGKLDEHFPLKVFQSGSGTQTNMNVNEVIANRANVLSGAKKGAQAPIHPNDHVNMAQSTNDVLPSAMHIASVQLVLGTLLPSLKKLRDALYKKQKSFEHIVKIGRTHLQDAVPLTVGQEFSGYVAQLDIGIARIKERLKELYELPLGGTAVGTGLNAHKRFGAVVVKHIKAETKLPFVVAKNRFALMAAHDSLMALSSAIKEIAVSLTKLAHDFRWLSSGPHCGLNELLLPANEPGSSIMPGKVNPTQCEALLMVCAQIIGADATITWSNARSDLELNVYKPVMIANLFSEIKLLTDATKSFKRYLVDGLQVNKKQLDRYLHQSLMLVTALTPIIGYDKAAKLEEYADRHQVSLREASLRLGYLSEEEFCAIIGQYL